MEAGFHANPALAILGRPLGTPERNFHLPATYLLTSGLHD